MESWLGRSGTGTGTGVTGDANTTGPRTGTAATWGARSLGVGSSPSASLRPAHTQPSSQNIELAGELHQLKLHKQLGFGAFSTVWRGTYDGESVAVKVLRPELAARRGNVKIFLREAELLKTIQSTGHGRHVVEIVAVKQVPVNFGPLRNKRITWAIVMEFMKGGALSSMVLAAMEKKSLQKRMRVYTDLEAVSWMLDVAQALEALHGSTLRTVHRDVKAENLLLCPAPSGSGRRFEAKLADFGLHVRLETGNQSSMLRRRRISADAQAHSVFCLPRGSHEGSVSSRASMAQLFTNLGLPVHQLPPHATASAAALSPALANLLAQERTTGGSSSSFRHSIGSADGRPSSAWNASLHENMVIGGAGGADNSGYPGSPGNGPVSGSSLLAGAGSQQPGQEGSPKGPGPGGLRRDAAGTSGFGSWNGTQVLAQPSQASVTFQRSSPQVQLPATALQQQLPPALAASRLSNITMSPARSGPDPAAAAPFSASSRQRRRSLPSLALTVAAQALRRHTTEVQAPAQGGAGCVGGRSASVTFTNRGEGPPLPPLLSKYGSPPRSAGISGMSAGMNALFAGMVPGSNTSGGGGGSSGLPASPPLSGHRVRDSTSTGTAPEPARSPNPVRPRSGPAGLVRGQMPVMVTEALAQAVAASSPRAAPAAMAASATATAATATAASAPQPSATESRGSWLEALASRLTRRRARAVSSDGMPTLDEGASEGGSSWGGGGSSHHRLVSSSRSITPASFTAGVGGPGAAEGPSVGRRKHSQPASTRSEGSQHRQQQSVSVPLPPSGSPQQQPQPAQQQASAALGPPLGSVAARRKSFGGFNSSPNLMIQLNGSPPSSFTSFTRKSRLARTSHVVADSIGSAHSGALLSLPQFSLPQLPSGTISPGGSSGTIGGGGAALGGVPARSRSVTASQLHSASASFTYGASLAGQLGSMRPHGSPSRTGSRHRLSGVISSPPTTFQQLPVSPPTTTLQLPSAFSASAGHMPVGGGDSPRRRLETIQSINAHPGEERPTAAAHCKSAPAPMAGAVDALVNAGPPAIGVEAQLAAYTELEERVSRSNVIAQAAAAAIAAVAAERAAAAAAAGATAGPSDGRTMPASSSATASTGHNIQSLAATHRSSRHSSATRTSAQSYVSQSYASHISSMTPASGSLTPLHRASLSLPYTRQQSITGSRRTSNPSARYLAHHPQPHSGWGESSVHGGAAAFSGSVSASTYAAGMRSQPGMRPSFGSLSGVRPSFGSRGPSTSGALFEGGPFESAGGQRRDSPLRLVGRGASVTWQRSSSIRSMGLSRQPSMGYTQHSSAATHTGSHATANHNALASRQVSSMLLNRDASGRLLAPDATGSHSNWHPQRRNTQEFERVFDLSGKTGTCIYMSPEIAKEEPYNEKADVFSFGMVMYELAARVLIQKTALGKDAIGFTRRMVAGERPWRPASVHPRLWQLVTACWHDDPLERPTMAEVVSELRSLMQELEAEAEEARAGMAHGCCRIC